MKNRHLLILIFLTFVQLASAQDITTSKLLRWLDSSKGLQVEFAYSIGDLQSIGTYYGSNQKFYVEVQDMLMGWYNGSDLWVYVVGSGEVNLSTPLPEDLLEINPLLNLKNINTKDFKIIEHKDKDNITIKAIPLKSDHPLEWLNVVMNKDAKPLTLQIKEKGMNEVAVLKIISLKQGGFNEMKNPDFFTFSKNKLPNVQVIDLR